MDPKQLAKESFEKVVRGISAVARELTEPPVPGTPGSEPPTLQEPTEPRDPLPPKTDQAAPETRTATGADLSADPRVRSQQGAHLATSQVRSLHNTYLPLKAG